ncbi:E1 [Macaca mulatta papillomavirus 2]|uniref:Replication protein E1 n=1 Tax=Macaca mulatta papillomavirus 2 TaxID=2294150 RepID=A0A385AH66_9PAPI|nr:E1 [Macaca mulatta papillomavirus 2]AXN57282.1 E1 [Macaca mulatta papillomavirus 2]
MADCEGTEEEGTGCNGWFFVEAVVDRTTGDCVSEDEDEDVQDSGLDMVDFIDNSYSSQVEEQAEARQLYNAQELQADVEAVQQLKRKYMCSPYVSPLSTSEPCIDKHLSPRLGAISISQQSRKAKRRLFDPGDGNTEVEATAIEVNRAEGGNQETGANASSSNLNDGGQTVGTGAAGTEESAGSQQISALLRCANVRVTLFGVFKDTFGVSFMDLARLFKSDKTACNDWIIAGFGVHHSVTEGFRTLLEPHCEYGHVQWLTCKWGMVVLVLARFKCAKNRTTVAKCMAMLLNIPETQMIIEPPKIRSGAAALYWYRQGLSNVSDVFGDAPEWLVRLTTIEHSMADTQFELSKMVQWAFDNDYTDDSVIAYEYAKEANFDQNAAAFLASNCQARYVKDCGIMCRHYKRAQKMAMSMGEYIEYRCNLVEEEGDWREIVKFLRFQQVDFIAFTAAFKAFLQGIPKKNCILLHGPPDTGKSTFAMSLMKFLGGAVISFVNSTSHFWLQPLTEAKIAMLDDATCQCWNYMDIHMRNALDGNPMCLDRKHKNMIQTKCPPLMITSNIDAGKDDRWRYLHSRLQSFCFPNPFPFDANGNPVYDLSNKNWKSFFKRSWIRLALNDNDNVEDDGDNSSTFRCVPGQNTRTV